VECSLLVGKTQLEVRAMLGKPTTDTFAVEPRRHQEWSYRVGWSPGRGSEQEDALFMEFDGRRVVFAEAPGARNTYDEIEDGRPVRGGRKDPVP
jgi:hypothetical protein